MLPDAGFWRGKRVLLTGHTGFKGAWLALWLHHLGADVSGLALAPATQPNLFALAGVARLLRHHVCDIRDPSLCSALAGNIYRGLVGVASGDRRLRVRLGKQDRRGAVPAAEVGDRAPARELLGDAVEGRYPL